MSKLKLRNFNINKDLQTILKWHREHVRLNFPDSKYKPELYANLVRDSYGKNLVLIGEVDGQRMAFLHLAVKKDPYKDHKYGDLRYIHVDSKYRKRGFGKELLKYTEDYFKKRGCKEIRLGTHVTNGAAIKFYKKNGFRNDRVLMVRKI